MGKLKSLINFLPPYYKEVDTYKDTSGKGILEKFLELCGTYLEDNITSDIEKTLDLYDISTTPSIYLNYLWEFLGEFPFGYVCLIDKAKWDQYYNGFDDRATQEAKANLWTLAKSGALQLSENRVRDLLRYTLALYKIRGTKKFYEVTFGIFGMKCTVTDPYEGSSYSSARGVYNNQDGWLNSTPRMDEAIFDKSHSDEELKVETCITVDFDIDIDEEHIDDLFDDEVVLLDGQIMNPAELADLITESDPDDPMLMKLRLTIEGFIRRFLPFNCKARVSYHGVTPDPGITITAEPVEVGNTHLIQGEIDVINAIVTVNSVWPYSDLSYQVSADGGNTWGKERTASEYPIYREGTYKFRSVADPTKIATLVIDRYPIEIEYYLDVTNLDGTTELSRTNPAIHYRVCAYKKADIFVGGIRQQHYFINLPFIDILTGQVYNPSSIDDEGLTTDIALDTEGTHRISLLEFRAYFEDLVLYRESAQYNIFFFKKVQGVWTAIDTTQVTDFEDAIQIKVEASNIYEDQNLKIKCLSNGKTYTSGDVITLEASGEYQFVCVTDIDQNIATLRLNKVEVFKWQMSVYNGNQEMFDTDARNIPVGSDTVNGIPFPIVMTLNRGDISLATKKVNVYYKGTLVAANLDTYPRSGLPGSGPNRRYLTLILTPQAFHGYVLLDQDAVTGMIDQSNYKADHLEELANWTDIGSGEWKIESVDDPTAFIRFNLYHAQASDGYTGLAIAPYPHSQDDYETWLTLECSDGNTYSSSGNDQYTSSDTEDTNVYTLEDLLDNPDLHIINARVTGDTVKFKVFLVVDNKIMTDEEIDWYTWTCPINISGTGHYSGTTVDQNSYVNHNFSLPTGEYTISTEDYQVQETLQNTTCHITYL